MAFAGWLSASKKVALHLSVSGAGFCLGWCRTFHWGQGKALAIAFMKWSDAGSCHCAA